MHGDAGGQHAAVAILLWLVRHHHDLAGAFGQHLVGDLRHGQHAVHGLAPGHGDRIVEQDLVGDIGLGGDGRPHGQQAGVEVGAVAQVDEHMLLAGEMHLAGPRHALAAHLAEGVGIAVHPQRHVVAADAGHGARAFRHAGGGVVRAARAEPGLALHGDARARGFALLGFDQRHARGDALAHVGGQVALLQAGGDGLGDQRRRQFIVRRQQPVAARHRPFAAVVAAFVELAVDLGTHVLAPVVKLFLERVFEDLAFFFHHQDLFQPGGELARVMRVQRPHAAHLEHADADAAAGIVVQAQVRQRLAHVEVGLARGHDAEARIGRIQHHAVELVGAHVGQRRIPLMVLQARFLHQRRIGPADIEPVRGHGEVLRQHDLHALGIDVDRGGGFDHVGHAFHRHPQAGVAAHGPAVQAIVQVLLHIGGIQHRDPRGHQHVLGLVRHGGGLGRVVVAGQQQHAAVLRRSGRVGVLEHVDRAVHARALAVPHAEHAVAGGAGEQVDLLRAPHGGGGQVLVHARLENHVAGGQVLLGLPQRLVHAPQGGAAIAGDKACGIEPGGTVARLLQHRQAHQRLGAAQVDAAFFQGVFVVQGYRR